MSRPSLLRRIGLLAGILVAPGLTALPLPAATSLGEPGHPVRFRRISVDQGLRHSVVYSTGQDATGFVWLATEGGLVRYDGTHFTHFEHRPFHEQTPSSQDASYVYPDSGGRLWIGTWGGGLELYEPRTESFTHFRHDAANPASLPDNRVQVIREDRGGALWIGTYRGLARVDPEHPENGFSAPADSGELAGDRIWSIEEPSPGVLWLGTDRGLVRFEPQSGRSQRFRHDPGAPTSLAHDVVRVVYCDREGTLWAGTQTGLDRLLPGGGGFEHFRHEAGDPASLPHDIVNALLEDSQGGFWVGTHFGGLALLDRARGRFVVLRHDDSDPWSLGNDDVRALMEDRSGMLWVATRGGGVSLLDLRPSPFRLWSGELTHPVVLSVLQDADETLWVGTLDGLTRLDGATGKAKRFLQDPSDPDDFPTHQIQALLRDRDGTLWVGTYGGLFTLDAEGRTTSFPVDPEDPTALANPRIQALLEDRSGQLWVGTRRGLHRLDRERRVQQRTFVGPGEAELADDFVWTLFEDRSGSLWVGTDVGGLDRLDRAAGTVVHHRHDPSDERSISNNRVRSLAEDAQGRLWVGTRNGLNRLDPATGTFDHYFEADGLPNASIHGLLVDDADRLWMSSNLGLASFDLRTGRIQRFDVADGLQGRLFSRGAYTRGPTGELFFGGFEGLTGFFPREVVIERPDPPVVLTGIRILNRPAQLDRAYPFVDRLELPWNDNFFSLEFAALEFGRPGRRSFAYRLAGFDPEWIQAGNRTSASYTDVRPGSYRFEVQLVASDGTPGPVALSLPVVVSPPWWRTRWSYAGAFLLLVSLVLGAHWTRIGWIRRDRERLAALVRDRTEEVRRQRTQLLVVSDIVQVINQETHFSALLTSTLEGLGLFLEADRGLALVRDPDGALRARAGHGAWSGAEALEASRDALEAACRDGDELLPGVFQGTSVPSFLAELDRQGEGSTRRWLALQIEIEDEVVGYLLLGQAAEEAAAAELPDRLALEDLRRHVTSAFVKGRMLEELRELNRKKNEFLGIAAHDLRSPLGGIRGHAELLDRLLHQGRLEVAVGHRFLEGIRRTADQMLVLIGNLLDVAAIESGRVDLELARVPWRGLLEERTSIHAFQARVKGIELQLDLAADLPEVIVDRDRITEVVDNLLSNALKFTAAGGTVRLICETRQAEVVTRIEDTGQGLDPGELPELFTGRRLSARPTAGETSTGLGLVIVKKIVDLHGGRVWASSEKGTGSTFAFSLPCAS